MIGTHKHADVDVLSSVHDLAQGWRQRFEEGAEAKELPAETLADISRHELMALGIGQQFAGKQVSWPTISEVSRIAGRSCPSTGWILTNCICHALIAERGPEGFTTRAFAGGPNQFISTASAAPATTAHEDENGVVLTGRFINSSGISQSDWVMVSFAISSGSKNRVKRYGLIPRADLKVDDTWNSSGLTATGTNSFHLEGYRVEQRHLADWQTCVKQETVNVGCVGADNDGYLQRVQLLPYLVTSLMAPILGCAEALISEQRKIISSRCNKPIPDGEKSVEHHSLAESDIELQSAQALYHATLSELHNKRVFAAKDIKNLRARAAYVVQLCRSASERGHVQCGMPAISNNSIEQRLWRDFQVMSSHRDIRLVVALQELGEGIANEDIH